jgi:prolyl oligopeptidase
MIKWFLLPLATLFFSYFLNAQFHYPFTKKVDQSDNYHGTIVADPYRWLENDTSEATKQWVKAENEVTFEYLNSIPFRDSIKSRLAAVYNYERYSIPFENNDYYYFYKNDGLQNQPVLYRQKGLNGNVETVIDPNSFSADATTQLDHFEVSKDGRYAAWSISRAGSDWRTVFVKDLTTMKDLSDSIIWVKGSQIQWQKNGFYYSRYPEPAKGKELSSANEFHQVWYHTVGNPQANDKLIYLDTINKQRFNYVYTSEDERYVFLVSEDRGKGLRGNSLFYQDSRSSDKSFKPIVPEIGNFDYNPIGEMGNHFYIYTNADAQNNKVMRFDPNGKPGNQWQTIIPESKENLQSASIVGGKLFLRYLIDVASHVYVYSPEGKKKRKLHFQVLVTLRDLQERTLIRLRFTVSTHLMCLRAFTDTILQPANLNFIASRILLSMQINSKQGRSFTQVKMVPAYLCLSCKRKDCQWMETTLRCCMATEALIFL